MRTLSIDYHSARPYQFPSNPYLKNLDQYTNFDPSHNSTLHSRQHTSQSPNPPLLPSHSTLLSSHISKEKSKALSASLKKHYLTQKTSEKLTTLKKLLNSKTQNSEILNTQFINSKRSSAAQSQKYLLGNIERSYRLLSEKTKKIVQESKEKVMAKPQKLANTLNKPGVATWMNLAAGGRMRSASTELPAPSGPSRLGNWEIFSGYLGPVIKPKTQIETFPEEREDRGFCYKIDPIYHNCTYDQAVHYLKLRHEGASKSMAARLSHKIYCNLHEKEVKFPENYAKYDDDYDKLTVRFEEYAKKNVFKEGEILKDEQIQPNFFEVPGMYGKAAQDCEKWIESQENKEKVKKDEKILDERLEKLKKMFKQSKRTKSLIQTHESKLNCEEVKGEGEVRHSVTVRDVYGQNLLQTGIQFVINSVLPRKNSSQWEGSEVVKENLEKIQESEVNSESEEKEVKKEQERDLEIKEETEKVHRIDFKALKFENFGELQKKGKIDEKIRKKIEKKQEIQSQTIQNLQEGLVKKLSKLKHIAETKKRIKEEGLKVSKIKKRKFIQKVKDMKEKKENESNEEAEQIKKRFEEKMKKAEENKKKLENEREKKLEEQRILYDSQRLFFEYLQSLPLLATPQS